MRKGQKNPKLAEINRSLEHRTAVSEAFKGQHHSPQTEFKEGTQPTNGFKKDGHTTTEFKKGHLPVAGFTSESIKSQWKDPEYRSKMISAAIASNKARDSISKESKLKMIAGLKGRHLHPETEIQKGQRISPKTEFTSDRVKLWWQDPEYRAKVIAGRLKNRRPTGPEKKLIEIIGRHNLPFKYTGDGSFILEGLNPDFVETNGRKIAIDVFGDYWHTLKADKESYAEDGRKAIFAKYGWKLIVLWEKQLKSLKEEEIVRMVQDG